MFSLNRLYMLENNTPANPPNGADPDNKPPQGETPPDNNDGGDGNPPEGMVQVSAKELEGLKTDAGRHRARKDRDKNSRRDRRRDRSRDNGGGTDDLDDKSLEKVRAAEEEALSAKKESFDLKLEKQVDKLLESDDYKNLSPSAKRLLKRNPSAYIDSRSETVEDAIEDIQDFLDDELDNLVDSKIETKVDTPADTTPPAPPVNGSAPSNTKAGDEVSTEGMKGPKRSTTVLKNLFKRQGISKKA